MSESAIHVLLNQIVTRWQVKPQPDQNEVYRQLIREFPEDAGSLSRLSHGELASLIDSKWPQNFLSQLTAANQIYYSAAYLVLFFDGIARRVGAQPYLGHVSSNFELLIGIPGFELAMVLIFDKDRIIAAANKFELEVMFHACIQLETHADIVELNPKKRRKLADVANSIWEVIY